MTLTLCIKKGLQTRQLMLYQGKVRRRSFKVYLDLNRSYQGAVRCTPFKVVGGRVPSSLARFISGEMLVEVVAQDMMERDKALKQLKYHLGRAQDHMTRYANAHRVPSKIKVEDWVYLKIRPLRKTSMPIRLYPKLVVRYYGPYQVVQENWSSGFSTTTTRTCSYSSNFSCLPTQVSCWRSSGRSRAVSRAARPFQWCATASRVGERLG